MSERGPQRLLERLPFPPYTSRDRHCPGKHFRGCVLFDGKLQSVELGSVRIRYLEVYEDDIHVPWWFAPNIPVLQRSFREEMAVSRLRAIESGWMATHSENPALRFATEFWVGLNAAGHSVALKDDLGTVYSRDGVPGGSGDTATLSHIVGHQWFTPSLPEAARRVEVSLFGGVFGADLVPD